ncbi:MAC/perforin domain-containing protein [Bacillus cereus group sp. BfR-BA-01309]|uniref:MAC/perforin domain-containing protein n=1 Tax=Bacillus cereus group sp. BfR-BA-01309 TaxID=2920286 RepID=UPI001F587CF0|nr:MAC/perforin domain-containing protein [Bacillus cereus group sp. BfR-BA-01309]
MKEIPYQNGMNLGLGYDVITNNGLVSSALDNVNLLRPVVQASGQKVQFSVEMLSNSLSLAEQVGVSVSASMSYGMTGSGSAKISLVQALKQNSFSIYVLVKVHVQNQQTLLDLTQIKMSDKAQLLYATNQNSFLNQYGTHFIYGLISGGEYYGILEIESKSAEEYRSIKAELSGKAMVGVMSASASGSFEQALNKLTSSYKLKATIIRDGSEGALQPISPEQLIKDAMNFPASVLNEKAIPFSVLIFPYSQIPHPDVKEIPIIERQNCLEKIARIYDRFIRQRNDLQYALDNMELFPGLDKIKVEEYILKISEQLDKLKATATTFNVASTDNQECKEIKCDDYLLNNILPNQTVPSPLGYTWLYSNGRWNGIWKRDGETNTFDCYDQLNEDGDVVTYKVDIYISGDDVTILRKDSRPGNNNPSLRGKLVDGGTRVRGEGTWSAKIDQRRL